MSTVVIIGASYGGLQVAHGLLKALPNQVKVVLINTSDKFYFNIAAPRIVAKPDAFKPEQYLIPIPPGFAKYPKGSFEFIKGSASSIDPDSKTVTISTEPQASVSYDYLVIASGSSTTSFFNGTRIPFKAMGDDTLSAIQAAQETISKARTAVIAGAGPIGVETAGELAEAWATRTGTSITLVSATWQILPVLKQSAGEAAEKMLEKANVKVIKSRKVEKAEQLASDKGKWTVTLDNGEQLKADVYISSTGVTPNNSFIPANFLSSAGWVNVDEHFRVLGSGQQPIYAIGDITTHPMRTSIKLQEQIPVVLANLKSDVMKKSQYSSYKPNQSVMMLVPVGSSTGTGQMMGMKPWGKLVSMFKGKDFFVSKAGQMVGLA